MANNQMSLENQIIEWSSWDEGADQDLIFNDVVLKVPFTYTWNDGSSQTFEIGHKFYMAYFAISESMIKFFFEETEEWLEIPLVLSFGQ